MVNQVDFRTTDTALATYLICSGYTLEEIDYSGPRYEYIFSNTNGILAKAQEYSAGRALVDPAAYQRVNRKIARLIKNRRQWWEE